MLRQWLTGSVVLASLGLMSGSAPALAAPPWTTLVPFKRVDADPRKAYELTESHGPWLIMCTSFAGPTAEQQAHDLVLELRQRFKIEAYSFRQTFDFTEPDVNDPQRPVRYNERGEPAKLKYLHPAKFEEIIRNTLAAVYGAKADTLLANIPRGALVTVEDLFADLPTRGLHISLPMGGALALWPQTRVREDGPLVVAYRATVTR